MTKSVASESQARIRKEKAQQQANKKKQQAARLAAKAEHLEALKIEVSDNDRGMRSIGEHALKALAFHASQREVAEAAGKSVAWVNRIKKWSEGGFAPAGPFSAESKAKRTRTAKSVQAPEHRPAEDERFGLGGNYPPEDVSTRARAGNGSADTEIDTEARKARNAAMDAAGAQAADDGSIPEFMRRTDGAPAAAALNGSGSMTAVAETLSPTAEAPTAEPITTMIKRLMEMPDDQRLNVLCAVIKVSMKGKSFDAQYSWAEAINHAACLDGGGGSDKSAPKPNGGDAEPPRPLRWNKDNEAVARNAGRFALVPRGKDVKGVEAEYTRPEWVNKPINTDDDKFACVTLGQFPTKKAAKEACEQFNANLKSYDQLVQEECAK